VPHAHRGMGGVAGLTRPTPQPLSTPPKLCPLSRSGHPFGFAQGGLFGCAQDRLIRRADSAKKSPPGSAAGVGGPFMRSFLRMSGEPQLSEL